MKKHFPKTLCLNSSKGKCNSVIYIFSEQPSNIDSDAFDALKGVVPSAGENPHAFGWYCFVSKFDQSVRKSWGAPVAASAQPAAGGDKKKDKKEKGDDKAKGKNAKQAAKDERLKQRQAAAAAKDEFKKDPNDPSAH